MRNRILTAVALAAAPLLGMAQAEGDPERGERIAYTCTGCHGIPFYKNVYPTYSVPRLGGQNEEYIVAALMAYRSGERQHATMRAQAATLSDQDIRDVAAYFVSLTQDEANSEGEQ
ncbi:MAG: cytochrome c [Wenzhouxiangellaceae bacterium]|nr:cytochrome c [Wenzhouxiangellaceae bacterium]